MDHGAPPWVSHSRQPPAIPPWRGVYPPPAQHPYRNYGYYQHYPIQGGGYPPWQDQWGDYYSNYPGNPARQIERRRPASRAEIYERNDLREPFRPLSRQAYDESYGFYEAESRELYGNRDPRSAHGAPETEQRRDSYRHMKQWVQNLPPVYYPDHNMVNDQLRYDAHHRNRGYEDGSAWQSDPRLIGSEVDRLEHPRSSTEASLLSQYRDSGMSSSSYELSQYMHDPADQIDYWNPLQDETVECTPQPTAPMKFSLPHVTVCFGARGQLVRVCPNFPDEGQPALVEIHSMEVLLHDTAEQEQMRNFPGPVQREDLHKVDVMNYCQQKASQCARSGDARSGDNALLWQVLLQMCRQNGCIAGTDLAELLLQGCKRESYKKVQLENDLISLSEDPTLIPDGAQVDLLTGEAHSAAETSARNIQQFTKLLFFGRKKEALDWAIKSHLWGHALFLSSKMDSRSYSWVMARFTSTLANNDPLQTLFQLMAGRIPQAATCTGDPKWGNWRPHLAVMLSNEMGDPGVNQRSILTMGDNLVLKGYIEAGHCCYLTAGIPLGQLCEKSDRLVLLGSNQGQPFKKFASTENIQRTEILEYCQSLGKSPHCAPFFQVYKFLYATRLLDYGLTSLALHYCECIASALLSSGSGSALLISELIKFSEHLRYSDPQILERPEPEQHQEPLWLTQLRALHLQRQASGGVDAMSRVSPMTCNERREPTPVTQLEKAPGVSDVPMLSDNCQQYAGDYTGSVPQNAAEENFQTSKAQYPNPQSMDAQDGMPYEWGPPPPAPSIQVPAYSAYEEPQRQETLEEVSGSPPLSGSFISNTFMMQPENMFRRVSVVSETSTVSVNDEDEEETSGNEPQEQKPEDKKGSSFGWFGWFRSKPTKEITATQTSTQMPKPSSQADPPPRPNEKTYPPPPASGYLPARSSINASIKGIKESEDQHKINRSAVLPESRGQQENTGIYSAKSLPGNPMTQSSGAIPLYNPSQFLQDSGRGVTQPSRPPRGRYPQQPR